MLEAVKETQVEVVVDYSVMETVDGNALFPEIFEVPGTVRISRRMYRHPDCIKSNPDYVPDPEVAKLALIWLVAPRQELALGLQGHTGTGKTELVMYLADKLNLPLHIVKVHGRMQPQDLEGSYSLRASDGVATTVAEFGPAAKAYSEGGILLLDEVDKASGELTSAMHLLVEGKPWPLEMFKQTLVKHNQCYVMGTANTFGGGHDYRYISSNQLDQAFLSRFAWLQTQYPDVIQESKILERGFPKLPVPVRSLTIKVANALRDAALGPDRQGVDDGIGAIFSTRVLTAWCYYMIAFGVKRKLRESLEFVFLRAVDRDEKATVMDCIEKVAGSELDKCLVDFLPKKA